MTGCCTAARSVNSVSSHARAVARYAKDAAMTLTVALNWAATSATALAFPALHGLFGAHTFLALAALSALSGAAGDRFVTGSAKSGGETRGGDAASQAAEH